MIRFFFVWCQIWMISVATTSITKPITVKLGLWSPTYQADGKIDPIGAQTMAAFLLAVDEINANNYLPNVRINVAVTFKEGAYGGITGAQELMRANFSIDSSGRHVPTNTFIGNTPIGVDFVVGTGNDDETEHAGLVFQNFKTVQLHTQAMNTKFALGRSYPYNAYKVQNVPVHSYAAMSWQEMACTYFRWSKLVVFASTEVDGVKSSIEVHDNTYCDLDALTVQSFDVGTTDFSVFIKHVKPEGALTFAVFCPPHEAGLLLEQMYDSGLLVEGTQVIGNDNLMHPDVIKAFKNPPNPPASRVKAIMRGIMANKFAPKVALKATPGGQKFVDVFSGLTSTAAVTSGGVSTPCSSRKDDTGKFMFRKTVSGKELCGGLDFSLFPSSDQGANLQDFTAYAYDAVYSFAQAVKLILNTTDNSKAALTGDNFYTYLVNNVTLDEGATGYVKYFVGMPAYQFQASGDREEGFYYGVYNFQDAVYDADATTTTTTTTKNGFVQVGRWNLEQDGLTLCTPENKDEMNVDIFGTAACATSVQFRTVGNVMPIDTHPPIYIVMEPGLRTLLLFFGALSLALTLTALGVTAHQRKTRLMRSSHVHMVWAILAGCACSSARTLVAGVLSTDAVCQARFFLGHLAFFATLLPLVWRMWRLIYLTNYKGLTRSKVTPRFVLLAHGGVMTLLVVYLVIAVTVGQPHQSWTTSETANQVTAISVCTLTYSQFEIALFVLEAVVVIYANKVAQGLKTVPDPAQEKVYYSLAMTTIFALCLLLWPIVSLINLPIAIQELIAGIGFFIAPLTVLGLVLGPKFWVLFSDEEAATMVASVRVKPSGDGDGNAMSSFGKLFAFRGVAVAVAGVGNGKEKKSKAARQQLRELVCLADSGLGKKKTYGEKVHLYRQQIAEWQALRMQLDTTADDGGGGYMAKSRLSSNEESEEGSAAMTVDQMLALRRGSAQYSRPTSETVYPPEVVPE